MTYSLKQRELLRLWRDGGLKRINLLEGAVRSGKTWISLVLWAFWVGSAPRETVEAPPAAEEEDALEAFLAGAGDNIIVE